MTGDGPRWRGVVGLALAFVAGSLAPALSLWGAATDRVAWEAWVHDSAGHFDWTPFIHPPLYNEFLWLGERSGELLGVHPMLLLAPLNLVLAGVVAAAVAWATARRCGAGWAALAVGLVALSTGAMRPFEQYPLTRLLVVLATLGCLSMARSDSLERRWLAAGTFACAFAAVELHLNAWLVLGPLLVGLALRNPERRRPLLILLAGLLLAFGATTFTGLWRVLADGPMNDAGWRPPMSWQAVTLEWSNYLLLAPVALWLLPAVRRRGAPAVGLALAAALGVHLAVVVGQMYTGLAIGGTRHSCHHYFELVDAVMVLAAVWALADAAKGRLARWLTIGAAVGLVIFQLWLVRSCWWVLGLRSGPGDSWL